MRGLRRRLASAGGGVALILTGVAAPPAAPRAHVEGTTIRLTAAGPGWSRVIRMPRPAEVVGFDWEGAAPGGIDLRVWGTGRPGPWTHVEGNPEEGPDLTSLEHRGRTGTAPVWVGSGARRIEVRVVEGRLSGFRLHAVHSEVPASPWGAAVASAAPAQPGIILRPQWGADESWRTFAAGCDGTPSYASALRNSFVHHTVNANDYTADEAAALVRAIYYYHTHVNGWCDIGYNFLIDRFGRIYEGRYGGITRAVVGAHAAGFNRGSSGAALMGDHRTVGVPAASRAALQALLAWKLTYHGVDAAATIQVTSGGSSRYPAGTVVTLSTISGHRDVSNTACPGEAGYSLLPQLRFDVQRDAMATPPYPLPGWSPVTGAPPLLVLSGYGGLHPSGGQAPVEHGGYWGGWAIARGATRDTVGGYVVDGWGGLHAYGGAPAVPSPAYWAGWDIVRGVARGPVDGSGWVLDGWGGLHPFGGAPSVPTSAYWPGWDIARALVSTPSGTGGYVLDGWGGLHPFGAAAPVNGSGYWPGWDIARAVALRSDGVSGYVLDGFGGLHPFGGAPAVSSPYYAARDAARGLILTADGGGGWIVDADGRVWAFGNAAPVATSLTWTGLGVARAVVLAP